MNKMNAHHDGHGGRGCMDPTLGLRGRHALDAVDSGFPFQLGVHGIPFHFENKIFVSSVIARRGIESIIDTFHPYVAMNLR